MSPRANFPRSRDSSWVSAPPKACGERSKYTESTRRYSRVHDHGNPSRQQYRKKLSLPNLISLTINLQCAVDKRKRPDSLGKKDPLRWILAEWIAMPDPVMLPLSLHSTILMISRGWCLGASAAIPRVRRGSGSWTGSTRKEVKEVIPAIPLAIFVYV